MSTKRICLWSGPRNISTALMYSFAQRPDTLVFDEPLYGYYLKQTAAKELGYKYEIWIYNEKKQKTECYL
jgi:hypothetical protein